MELGVCMYSGFELDIQSFHFGLSVLNLNMGAFLLPQSENYATCYYYLMRRTCENLLKMALMLETGWQTQFFMEAMYALF